MLDRLLDFLNDIPLGSLIFIGALLWSFIGRKSKPESGEARPRPAQEPPVVTTYASDERRAREEREQWGHLDFGSQDDRYAGASEWGHLDFSSPDDRYNDANEWGQTKYGFESTDWGSSFDDKNRADEPRIVGRG